MNEELLSKIGRRIQSLREEQNITQQELADSLGIRRPVIGKWEVGLQDLKTDNIIAIANYFGVSCDYLLCVSEYKSAINEIIAQDMRLSDEAIDLLKDPFNLEIVDAILCSDEALLKKLFRNVIRFLKPEHAASAFIQMKLSLIDSDKLSDDIIELMEDWIEEFLISHRRVILEDIKLIVTDILIKMETNHDIMDALDNIDIHYGNFDYEEFERIINNADNQETVSDNEE